jgi:hypothetical protein
MERTMCFSLTVALLVVACLTPSLALARGSAGGARIGGGPVVAGRPALAQAHPQKSAPHASLGFPRDHRSASNLRNSFQPFFPFFPFAGWYGDWWDNGYAPTIAATPQMPDFAPSPSTAAVAPAELPPCRETVAGVTVIRGNHCHA